MKTDATCIFCGGTGTIVGFDPAGFETTLWPCRLCKGTGRQYDTLTPFLEELDDLQLVIDVQARFMEDVSNIGLQEMADAFDLRWAYREHREQFHRLRERVLR